MLTSYQAETVAYLTDGGEVVCSDCITGRLESEGWTGGDLQPLIRYEADAWDAENSVEYLRYEDADHADYCGCTLGIPCDWCGVMIVEPYEDEECKGRDDAERAE